MRDKRKEQLRDAGARGTSWILKWVLCAFCAFCVPALNAQSVTIPPASLPNGTVGVFYAQQLAASGPSPLVWSVTSGILPPGVVLSSSGALVGTPGVQGNFTFTVQATAA